MGKIKFKNVLTKDGIMFDPIVREMGRGLALRNILTHFEWGGTVVTVLPTYIEITSRAFDNVDCDTFEGLEEDMRTLVTAVQLYQHLTQGGPREPSAAAPQQHLFERLNAVQTMVLGTGITRSILITLTGLDPEHVQHLRDETLQAIADLHIELGIPSQELLAMV